MKKVIFLCVILSVLCISCSYKPLINTKYPAFGLAYTVGEEYPVRIITGNVLDEKHVRVQIKMNDKWVHVKTKLDTNNSDVILGYIVIGGPDYRFEKIETHSLVDFFKEEMSRINR